MMIVDYFVDRKTGKIMAIPGGVDSLAVSAKKIVFLCLRFSLFAGNFHSAENFSLQ